MTGARRPPTLIAPSPADLASAYRTRDPGRGGHQQAEAACVGTEGITVLCSVTPAGGSERTGLIRLSDEGSVLWEHTLAPEHGAGRAMVPLLNGGYAIAGDRQLTGLEFEARMLHLDAAGQLIASCSFGPRGVTGLLTVTVLEDGATLAGGIADGCGWLLCVDEACRTRWELPLADVDAVRGLDALPAREFAVASSQGASTTSLGMTQIARFTPEPRPRWRTRLPSKGRGEPAALAALPGGNLLVVGHRAADAGAAARCWVQRLDPAGKPVWERELGSDDEERRGRALAVPADGGVVVASDALRKGRRGLRVARLAADGSLVWERHLGGGADAQDVARGIACTADGGFLLVGSTVTRGPGTTGAWVLRLDSEGLLLWDRVFGCAA